MNTFFKIFFKSLREEIIYVEMSTLRVLKAKMNLVRKGNK